ncbi:MAG: glycoside hydrolase family 2 protein [Butyrivibrio sp.]|uniref:glycoside hydrolase family 2 protein n=1 Tax=Butyrivibrio sp. TaxID=28121 RepID=UPI001B069C99|nr:glycoside hydrolase family 2 TIM barrel-domain containing protein [Butyrivibrio sp.]MBO6241304.1 glycoside hydrolase family 2 protein [Butyrivibrio sp.]
MRKIHNINNDWNFSIDGKEKTVVNIPHTWNNIDGQDGGNDYLRTLATYEKRFECPSFDRNSEDVYLEFDGVNSECDVFINDQKVLRHEGGYSTFRENITEVLMEGGNNLLVKVDNRPNDKVYPQKADFTFYGGIYRDVKLIVVNKKRFDLDYFGGSGIQVTANPIEGYKKAKVSAKMWLNTDSGEVRVTVFDKEGNEVCQEMTHRSINEAWSDVIIQNVHLWDGIDDPYLYRLKAELIVDEIVVDEVETRFGVRDFHYHPKTGFYLNGRKYTLHGVSRHQDRKGVGNAITDEMHKEDMDLICEVGANTIRLAHYQHSQTFYDLCDERGMVVWAEIPYISEHMPNARANTISQMKELIIQNYNHPSIVCWGISNEITISTKDKNDMLDNHRELNDLCHEMDKTRFTTLACYAVCGPFNKVAHITDTVSWNLYLGWYVPGLFLNDIWMRFFHFVYPDRSLGYSEYGCEGMPNLHSEKPKRGDHTEEYQAHYHEYMLRCFERNPFMWATHVWNMFDFAADARNQGGEPGMNHKGLITFDRKTKKDSFYIYKAWWSKEPFVHITSKRFRDRTSNKITVKVYSNQNEVTLYKDGNKLETRHGQHVFEFKVSLTGENEFMAVSGACRDKAVFRKVSRPNPEYTLKESGDKGANWTK